MTESEPLVTSFMTNATACSSEPITLKSLQESMQKLFRDFKPQKPMLIVGTFKHQRKLESVVLDQIQSDRGISCSVEFYGSECRFFETELEAWSCAIRNREKYSVTLSTEYDSIYSVLIDSSVGMFAADPVTEGEITL